MYVRTWVHSAQATWTDVYTMSSWCPRSELKAPAGYSKYLKTSVLHGTVNVLVKRPLSVLLVLFK